MDSDSWARIAAYSRRRLSRSDVYNGEGCEVDEEPNPEYICPFCAEDFDMVGLCCHIDEMHPISAKNGVCPVCTRNVGSNLVRHLTGQHGSVLKVPRRRRFLRRGSNSPLSIVRRELRDGSLQSLFGGPSHLGPTGHTEPDPMLSSFILSPPVVDKSCSVQSLPSTEADSTANVQKPEDSCVKLSEEDMKEKARRCEFVNGLLLSTFLDDNS